MNTALDGGCEIFDESLFGDGEATRAPRESQPNNLTLYRWRGESLGAGEELDLLRSAQAGDAEAKRKLVEAFHRLVLKIASEFYGPSKDDLIAAGLLGLGEAIAEYDLRRNTRLSSFAIHKIRNAVRAEVKRWRRRGQAGETRADRWVYSHSDSTPEQVATKVGCSTDDASEALDRVEGYWTGHEQYDTTERGNDDDEECPRKATVAPAPRGTLSKWLRISRQIDRWADECDRRAMRRLREIGRRAYALELVERDRARFAARSNPRNYLYPWCRDAA